MKATTIKCLTIAALSALMSVSAVASDLVLQDECGLPGTLEGWKVSLAKSYIPANKQLKLGTNVAEGDVLFYAAFKDAQRIYTTSEEIQFKDRSPLNKDIIAQPGTQFPSVGLMTRIADGKTFEIIETEGSFISKKYFPVRPDGYVCNDKVGKSQGRFELVGMPQVFQGAPLTSTIVENTQNPGIRSIAVVLQHIDGAMATVSISFTHNNQQTGTVTRVIDAIGGTLDLSGLQIRFHKAGRSAVPTSVTEPANYYVWMDSFTN